MTLGAGDVFTGTLQDGSAFIFSDLAVDTLVGVTLAASTLPTLNPMPVFVDTPLPASASGLRAGQTLTLRKGGELGDNFESVDATLNVEGGILGSFAGAARSEVNISGGTVSEGFLAYDGAVVNVSDGAIGDEFVALPGSEVNISGGSFIGSFSTALSKVNISGGAISGDFVVLLDSEVNLFGTEFFLNGEPIDGLTIDDAFEVLDRDLTS